MAELDQRFQLGEVGEDQNKITWRQLLIGATGSILLSGLGEDATWEHAKETLLSCLGIGSVKDEAWAALKNLKKGSKEIVELAGEAEKLAKRLHPRDEEERHAIDKFLGVLERPLAAEVQKLGCRTMEDVVATARRIEKILEEQADSKLERLISSMQDQIRLLKKDLKDAHDQISAHQTTTTPTAALAATLAVTVAAAHPPPLAPAQPPPLATAQPPPTEPARHLYQGYPRESPYLPPPRRQPDRRPPHCFLCGEEGHFVSYCPARSVLQRLRRQQASADARGPPGGQVLELPPTQDDGQTSPNVRLNC